MNYLKKIFTFLNTYIAIFQKVVFAFSFVFIFYFLIVNVNYSHWLLFHENFIILLLLIFLLTFSYFASALVWLEGVRFGSGISISFIEVVQLYFRSSIAKYVPGNFLHFVGRNTLGKKLGISQITMTLSTILELLVSFGITFSIISILLLFNITKLPFQVLINQEHATFYFALFLFFILMIYFFKGRIITFWSNLKTYAFSSFLEYIIKIIFFSLNGFVVNFLVVLVLINIYFANSLDITAKINIVNSLIISAYLGMIPLGTPGGIGLREAFSVYLLSKYNVSIEDAATIAILLRLLLIFADMSVFMISFIIKTPKKLYVT